MLDSQRVLGQHMAHNEVLGTHRNYSNRSKLAKIRNAKIDSKESYNQTNGKPGWMLVQSIPENA